MNAKNGEMYMYGWGKCTVGSSGIWFSPLDL